MNFDVTDECGHAMICRSFKVVRPESSCSGNALGISFRPTVTLGSVSGASAIRPTSGKRWSIGVAVATGIRHLSVRVCL